MIILIEQQGKATSHLEWHSQLVTQSLIVLAISSDVKLERANQLG